jgi:hypothetical protein
MNSYGCLRFRARYLVAMNELRDQILGLYDFGRLPIVFYPAARDPLTLRCTEVHEHIHWVLATSTTFGLFQLYLAHLKLAHPSEKSRRAFSTLLEDTVHASWYVQEGLATFEELRVLRSAGQAHEEDQTHWRHGLPSDYAEAVQRYERSVNQFHLPADLRWGLAHHIAHLALNSYVLAHFGNRFEPDLRDIAEYLSDPANSPDERVTLFLELVRNQARQVQRCLEAEVLVPFAERIGLKHDYFLEVEGYPDVGDRDLGMLEAELDEHLRIYFEEHCPEVSIVPLKDRDLERATFAKRWHKHYRKTGIDFHDVLVMRAVASADEESDSRRESPFQLFSDLQPAPGTLLPLHHIDNLEEFVLSKRGTVLYCRLCPLAVIEGRPTAYLGTISMIMTDEQLGIPAVETPELPCTLAIFHAFRGFEHHHAAFGKEGWFYLLRSGELKEYLEKTERGPNTLFVALDFHVDFDEETVFTEAAISDFRQPLYVVPHMTSAQYLALYLGWIGTAERPLKLYTLTVGTEGLTFLVGRPTRGAEFHIIAPITETTERQLGHKLSGMDEFVLCQSFEEYETDKSKIEQYAIVAEHLGQYGY